jgi:hypothetical protein
MMERRFEVGDRIMQVLRDKMSDEALAAESEVAA